MKIENLSIIYLDNAATTRIHDDVLKAMLPYFTEYFGNASSNNQFGEKAKNAVELARQQVADLINCHSNEIIFTSGATESINLALKGYVEANQDKGNHIITVKTEHKAVLATCEYLEQRGVDVTYLNVDSNGLISLEELEKSIRRDTLLISVMHVNNEIGVIQPIEKIGKIAKIHNVVFFTDATQAVGKLPIDVTSLNIGMLALSAHKLKGPKGVGVLYKRKELQLSTQIHGGGQENNLRGGTLNSPLIVGLGEACRIARLNFNENLKLVEKTRDYLISNLATVNAKIVGDNNHCLPYITNVIIPDLIDSSLFIKNDTKYVLSNSSACNSQIIQISHVLKALGISLQEGNKVMRISINEKTTTNEIDLFIDSLKNIINSLVC